MVGVPFPSFPASFAPTPSFFSVPAPAPPPPAALVALRGEKSLLVPLPGERMDEDEDEEEGVGEEGRGGGDLDVEVEEEEEEAAGVGVGAGAVGYEMRGGTAYVSDCCHFGSRQGNTHANTLHLSPARFPSLPPSLVTYQYSNTLHSCGRAKRRTGGRLLGPAWLRSHPACLHCSGHLTKTCSESRPPGVREGGRGAVSLLMWLCASLLVCCRHRDLQSWSRPSSLPRPQQ